MVSFSENPVFLKAGEKKTITAYLIVPENASVGYYAGRIDVYFFKS